MPTTTGYVVEAVFGADRYVTVCADLDTAREATHQALVEVETSERSAR